MKIRGVNLGQWLVLEKWMDINFFEGIDAEDETYLVRKTNPDVLAEKMKAHRDTYVTEEDFAYLEQLGVNLVRIPVPYFVFGDRSPFIGCIEYLDRAFEWAEKHNIQVLIDMHTVPGSQNGYDNGGLTGVCKWCKNPKEVEFILTVLERLAERYKNSSALYGIEVLNEPISFPVWVTSPSFGKAEDEEEAKGSWFVPKKFLESFYVEAYTRLRNILSEDKIIVFHDGFRFTKWKKFFKTNHFKNVVLDTHIYIFAMQNFVPIRKFWVYQIYVGFNAWKIRRVSKYVPVMVGEWSLSNKYSEAAKDDQEMRRRYQKVARLQLNAWNQSAGSIHWNYQLWRDRKKKMDEVWKEAWDFARDIERGWMPLEDFLK